MLVDIGGRRLNLYCMGSGSTTVLFDAGGSDWSVVWALVQPAVAQNATACAYDRAGLGYSDSGPGPRSPFAIVDDLHKLLRSAALDRPVVLVGHSLGGFNVKLYTALYPDDVAGLVLIDPAEERDNERTRDFLTRHWGARIAARCELSGQRFLAGLINRYGDCAAAAQEAPLDPTTPSYRRCTDPVRPALGPVIAAGRAEVQGTAKYQSAQASELAHSPYGDPRADSAYANLLRPGALGNVPLIVLSAAKKNSSDPLEAAEIAAGDRLHDETMLLSSSGCREVVAATGHNIQIDRPDAVISAVNRMIRQIERGSRWRRSGTIPAGETSKIPAGTDAAAPRCAKDRGS